MNYRLLAIISIVILGSTYNMVTSQNKVNPLGITTATASQGFSVGESRISPNEALKNFILMVDSLDNAGQLQNIEIEGSASPEGPKALNKQLSLKRAEAVKEYILSISTVHASKITTSGIGENWKDIEQLLNTRNDLPAKEITSIVRNTLNRDKAEQELRALPCWPVIRDEIFPRLRYSTITLRLVDNTEIEMVVNDEAAQETEPAAEPEQKPEQEPTIEPEPEIETIEPEPVITIEEEPVTEPVSTICPHRWHLATNALEWGMFISNITGEWDFDCRWSVAMSVHFSALNYFTSTRKFRTFIIRPEARYWLKDGHNGVFIEGHLQMAAYNFALSSWKYRIQDVDGKTPALGGGLGIGYRLPVGHSGHWALEAQAGIGVYRLKYNRFENHIDGRLIDTRSKTWCGIDNIALSVVYNF